MTTTTISARHASQYRRYIRQQCRAASFAPIHVVDGAAAPSELGESGYYTTPGGAPVYHPNAYRRAWGKPVYHCSTIRVEVGREWLAAKCIPVEAVA